MLFIALSLSLITYFIVKVAIIVGASHEETYIMRIAIIQCLQDKKASELPENCWLKQDTKQILDGDQNLTEWKRHSLWRKVSLIFSVCILLVSLGLSLLFYDLHILSCLFEPSEDFIEYKREMRKVELRYSDALTASQKTVGIILFLLALIFLLNCLNVYYYTFKAVDSLKQNLKKKKQQQSHS